MFVEDCAFERLALRQSPRLSFSKNLAQKPTRSCRFHELGICVHSFRNIALRGVGGKLADFVDLFRLRGAARFNALFAPHLAAAAGDGGLPLGWLSSSNQCCKEAAEASPRFCASRRLHGE